MRGRCDKEKNCVSSKNYPKPHGNNDSCWVTMLAQCQLETQDPFEVESKKDHLMILNKDRETKEDVPKSLPKGNEFSWITSNTGTKKGWKICMTPSSNLFFNNFVLISSHPENDFDVNDLTIFMI